MLKNCILPLQNDYFLNKTCGEIICESETSFTLICKFCKMKIFQFKEFVEHFLLIHLPDIRDNSITPKTSEISSRRENIKTESFVENGGDMYDNYKLSQPIKLESREGYTYEEYKLSEPVKLDSIKIENLSKVPLQENDNLFFTSEEDGTESADMYQPLAILTKKLNCSDTAKEAPYKCTACSRSFTKECYRDMHEKQKHRVLQFQCNECNRSFAEEILLKQHQSKHTAYPCEECGKSFKKKVSLRFHMNTHTVEKKFICDFENCGKAFMNKRRLSAHKHVHLLKFVCEICGSRRRHKQDLINHLRTHTGEKPFVCDLCDHRFTSNTLLREHQACHETERKHICDVCGKSFNRQKALYHHKHLHLGIKKFVCKICGAAYAQAAGLSVHMRKHKEHNS